MQLPLTVVLVPAPQRESAVGTHGPPLAISRGHTRPSPCNQPGAHIHPSPRDQPWAHTALPSDALPPTPSVVTEPRAEAWLHCSLPLAAYLSADTGNDSQASQNNLRKKKKKKQPQTQKCRQGVQGKCGEHEARREQEGTLGWFPGAGTPASPCLLTEP